MLIAFAEVFHTNAIDVSDVGGTSDVDLALVNEFLKKFFVGFSPGLYWGGVIGHGPAEDCGIVLMGWLVGCCVLLAVVRASLANAFSHAQRM